MARQVNGREFLAQLADHTGLVDGYVRVDLEDDGEPAAAWLRLGIDDDVWTEMTARIEAADTPRALSLIVLDGRPDVTAEDQLDLFYRNEFTDTAIHKLFWSERGAALQRIAAFRYRPGAAATA